MKRMILGFLGALIIAGVALAQPPQGPPDSQSIERIERWKKLRLIELLNLSEDQSVRFFARMNEHETARRAMMKQKGEALDRLERLVRNRAEASEFEKVIPEVLTAEDQIRAEQRKFFTGLSDILSVEQRAKLLLFERQFERELREAMREVHRKRSRGEGE
jgi:Spy/CpxP family protein refolding chaperone